MGIFDIFTNKNAEDAAQAQIAGIRAGYDQLTDLFGQGRGALTSNYTTALQPFLTNLATGQQGTSAYADATGVNGPAGNARATTAFWNNPAIQSQLDIGSQNVLRNQAATGQLNSGKTNVDLQNYGQQVASQGWNNYLASLTPFLNLNQGSAAGAAGVYTGLGQGLNQSFMNQGNAAYGAQTGIGNANANADLANNAASGNIWGAIMNGAKLATSLFSDERLKEDIERVGKLYDGQNIYSYRYKGDGTPRIGLMAQEVERTNPDAVTEIGGFKAVDYGRATEFASKLSRFLEAA